MHLSESVQVQTKWVVAFASVPRVRVHQYQTRTCTPNLRGLPQPVQLPKSKSGQPIRIVPVISIFERKLPASLQSVGKRPRMLSNQTCQIGFENSEKLKHTKDVWKRLRWIPNLKEREREGVKTYHQVMMSLRYVRVTTREGKGVEDEETMGDRNSTRRERIVRDGRRKHGIETSGISVRLVRDERKL
ncbi:hypothetical protein BD769DRAFT_1393729 [Suillus cothurnatus]|nr:hypothetical protein BD769DRAFT_1393729 [Suillus cothurnatus]